MPKITKKELIEKALSRYSEEEIEKSIRCKVIISKRTGGGMELRFNLTNRWCKTKAQKIQTEIKGFLMNIKPDDSNKRMMWDTSSKNIESIKIKLFSK